MNKNISIETMLSKLHKSHMLGEAALHEYVETGKIQTPCPNCGELPVAITEGLYGERFTIKCPCGSVFLMELGI